MKNAAGHPIEHRAGNLPGVERRLQRFAEIRLLVEREARILIEPGIGRGDRGVSRAPIGHHIALEAPIAPQHVRQQIGILAGVRAVDEIVRTHHRSRLPGLDRDFERQQIGHAHRRIADHRVDGVPVRLLIVDRVMLDRGDDVIGLDAGDLVADDRAGEQRILPAIFEIAAVARIAQQIDAAREHDVEARIMRFAADHRAAGVRQFGVPGCRRSDTGGQGGSLALFLRGPLGRHADPGIGLPLRRDAETRDAGNIAGRSLPRLGRLGIVALPGAAEIAEHQRQLFLLGHGPEQRRGALIDGERTIHPRALDAADRQHGLRRRGGGAGRSQQHRQYHAATGKTLDHVTLPRSFGRDQPCMSSSSVPRVSCTIERTKKNETSADSA